MKKKIPAPGPVEQNVAAFAAPVRQLSDYVMGHGPQTCKFVRKTAQYTFSVSLVFIGGYLATVEIHCLPHFVVETLGYSVHGIALTPIAEEVLGFLRAVRGKA